MSDLERFKEFLSTIDLDGFRDKYFRIRTVELNMPKHVQALSYLYKEYWEKRNDWIGYEEFYSEYSSDLKSELEDWRTNSFFSKQTFYKGLPARIYRTWAALLTQIQGAYVAESIYGAGRVKMGVKIDQSGVDMIIEVEPGLTLPVQIKKISGRKEALRATNPNQKFIELKYAIPETDKYRLDGEVREPFKRWEEKWGNKLEILENGFIIFRKEMFEREYLISLQDHS